VAGSDPFNYPRLVQPVLDAKCVSCHGANRKNAAMPDLRKGDFYLNPFCFHTSFLELIQRGEVAYYTCNYKGTNIWDKGVQSDRFVPAYSEPDKTGARGSKLYARLKDGRHHGVTLTNEEMRRLVVFMDSQASYLSHDTAALAQCEGRVVDGVAFPDNGVGKIACNARILIVGGSRMGACVARGVRSRRGARNADVAVITDRPLSAEVRAIYESLPNVMIFENVAFDEIVRGRAGFVTGIRFTDGAGRSRIAQGAVLFDATGKGDICRVTGAKMTNGRFAPGPDWCYPYLPEGSRNVLVADETAAVPPETALKLTRDPATQDALGMYLGCEAWRLSCGLQAIFTPLGY
jgi:hypothetical protein